MELTFEKLDDRTGRFLRWRIGRWIHILDRETGEGWWEWIRPSRLHDYYLFPDPQGERFQQER